MQLLYPIKNPRFDKPTGKCVNITQYFGENYKRYKDKFGIDGHNGIDFIGNDSNSYGSPILAAHDGFVSDAVWDGEYSTKGNGVYLFSNDRSYRTTYWHLSKLTVATGKIVKAGDELGKMGNSGWSSGTHLHFGVREYKNGAVVNYDNGLNGCIDPLPYLTTSFNSMQYVIIGTEQYLLYDDLKMALNIGSVPILKKIQVQGLSGLPVKMDKLPDGYIEFPLVDKDTLKDIFGF